MQLDPRVFGEEHFRDDITNLIQINVRGRILQVAFRATPDLISTEDFRVPYTLEGTVRAVHETGAVGASLYDWRSTGAVAWPFLTALRRGPEGPA